MYKTVNDFYHRDVSIAFDLMHEMEEENSKTKKEKTASVQITAYVEAVASSQESNDWYITIGKTFFYGHLIMNHLSYDSENNSWYSRACLKENQEYNPKNLYIAENIKVKIL